MSWRDTVIVGLEDAPRPWTVDVLRPRAGSHVIRIRILDARGDPIATELRSRAEAMAICTLVNQELPRDA